MTQLTPSDWDALQNLVGRVGLPVERVALLRLRLENGRPRPGSPYTLLVGRPQAGIELLLRRWLGDEVEEALRQADGRPLVIGPTPENLQPRLGAWPTCRSSKPLAGHLVVLCSARKPAADVLAQLSSVGLIEQVILVSRLFQAMHGDECEMLQSLAPLAATVRVLLAWQPGEEPSDADLVEVPAAATHHLRRLGFDASRSLGASVWYAGQTAAKPGLLATPGDLLRIPADTVAAGREGMARQALAQLLREVAQRAAAPDARHTEQRPIPPEEGERLVRELETYLAALGREVERLAITRPGVGSESVRKHVLDAIHGWGAYTGIEGHWMKYVESLRPGLRAALLTEASAAAEVLDYQPTAPLPSSGIDSSSQRLIDRAIVEAKRLAVGLVCGLGAYGLASRTVALPPVVDMLVKVAALLVAGVLGYGIGLHLFRAPSPSSAAADPTSGLRESSGLHGWDSLQRRLISWFADQMRARPASPVEECRALAGRLSIKELVP